MNDLQKSYCDGAAMAYRDVSNKIRQMQNDAPAEIKHLVTMLEPIAQACEAKAKNVYVECENFTSGVRQ